MSNTPVITGWALTDATNTVSCDRCKASVGKSCRTPKGRLAVTPHVERSRAYRMAIGAQEWRRRHERGGR